MVDQEERASHYWVKRTLYKNGKDSEVADQLIHFDPDDEATITKAFTEVLVVFGRELGLSTFAPIHMDVGRWVIESEEGFSVVEIDPAWTHEQIERMETDLDLSVWGGIFS